MVSIARLQTYLRYSARRQYDAVAVPPFTLFFHPSAALPYFNYAIPDQAAGADLQRPLARLRAEFNARGRQPRLEFIEAFAPDLAAALSAEGFVEEARLNLMICTVDTYRPAPPVPGLTVSVLTGNAPIADVQESLSTQRRGFDPGDTTSATPAQAAQFLQRLGDGRAVLARLDGQPVGAGTVTAPHDGLAEVAGIATLAPFRRRGVASLLTSEAVRTAFAQGVEVALLTAADKHAGRVYERIGFRPYATVLAYSDEIE
jgi:ribosomal protein S18 acetylase RimI-like enzyme